MTVLDSSISILLRKTDSAASQVAESITRLASGLRINTPNDDAAALSLATTLRSDTRVYQTALKNVNDGLFVTAYKESALTALSDIAERLEELAEEGSNPVTASAVREAMDEEASTLATEFNRIINDTKFNGTAIFNNNSQTEIVAGKGNNNIVTVAALEVDQIDSGGVLLTTGFSTPESSEEVLTFIGEVQDSLTNEFAKIDASESRLQVAAAQLEALAATNSSAVRRITDVDTASEIAKLVSSNIISNSLEAINAIGDIESPTVYSLLHSLSDDEN